MSEYLFTGDGWSYDTIQRIHDAVAEIAIGELGLDIYPNQIEIITAEQMLDAYASQAREKHNIPTHRLVALAVVTGDIRLINALIADTNFIAVEARFESLIRRELAREARDRLDREINSADAQWKASR